MLFSITQNGELTLRKFGDSKLLITLDGTTVLQGPPRRAGREPAKEQSLLLPHAPEQITAHKAEIYPSDTQAIRILAPARWHQFGFTAQLPNYYLAHNQYVRKSQHAR